jgi:cytochrome c
MPRFTIARSFLLLLIGAGLLLATPLQGQQKARKRSKAPAKTAPLVSYKKDVFPVFKTYCLPCHTEDQLNPSELYLDTYEGLMRGGKHGVPVFPAHADSSIMIMKLGTKPPFGDPMPFKRKTPVPQDTVDILKKWIGQGAKNN